MFKSTLMHESTNVIVSIIIIFLIGLQWLIYFSGTILSKMGLFNKSTQLSQKIPIITGIVSPDSIPQNLKVINSSNPNSDNFLQILPSSNQSLGLEQTFSFWLNVNSQQNTDISGNVIFYKGSKTKNKKLQFQNSQGLFHIDVSIVFKNNLFIATFTNNPSSDTNISKLISAILSKQINFIILINDLNNFYQVQIINSDTTPQLQLSNLQTTSGSQKDLTQYKVLKFAAYNNRQDVTTTKSYTPFQIGYEYTYKTPLLRFGNTVNDLVFEFNETNTLNSYYITIFDKNSQPYTLNFNKFFHLAIVINDHLNSGKRTGTDLKFYVNGVLYKSQTIDAHIHFNYGNFYIFPTPSTDNVINLKQSDNMNVQLADLFYYRQSLPASQILSIFKAGYTNKTPVITSSKKQQDNLKLYTQNYNNK